MVTKYIIDGIEFVKIKEGKNYSYLIPSEKVKKPEISFDGIDDALDNFLDLLSCEVRYHIKDVFILSELEVFGSWIWGKEDPVPPRKPFKFFRSRENRIKYLVNSWLRTPYYNDSNYFCRVYSYGDAGYGSASNTRGLAPVIEIETEYLEKRVLKKKEAE